MMSNRRTWTWRVEDDEQRSRFTAPRPRPPIMATTSGLQVDVGLRCIWRLDERDGTTPRPWGPASYVLFAWTGPNATVVRQVRLPEAGTELDTVLTLFARREQEGEEETTLRLELVRLGAGGARWTDPGPSNHEVVVGRARVRLRTDAGELCRYTHGLVHLVGAFPSRFVGGIKMDMQVSIPRPC